MNDQLQMVIRYFLTLAGALATQKGWISASDFSTLTADLLAALGPLIMLGTFLWGLYSHSNAAKVASVNAAIDQGKAFASPSSNRVVAKS